MSEACAEASVAHGTVYVQVAAAIRYHTEQLTLLDLAPSTIYVTSDEVGYLPTGRFLDGWVSGQSAHGHGPRHAVLSLLDADSSLARDSRWLLDGPRIQDAGLSYDAQLRGGVAPASSGACVLVIGPET